MDIDLLHRLLTLGKEEHKPSAAFLAGRRGVMPGAITHNGQPVLEAIRALESLLANYLVGEDEYDEVGVACDFDGVPCVRAVRYAQRDEKDDDREKPAEAHTVLSYRLTGPDLPSWLTRRMTDSDDRRKAEDLIRQITDCTLRKGTARRRVGAPA